MTPACLQSVSLIAPGLPDWPTARPVLSGHEAWEEEALQPLKPDFLPSNERRRTTPTIKLALQAAQQAIPRSESRPENLATVFASSCGDMEVNLKICHALAEEGSSVSPIQFHNSVHNAAAGYWSIALQSTAPSVSLGAFDGSFGAGLLEAYTQVVTEGRPVLLVAYDLPPPPPIDQVRPLKGPFATAVLIGPETAEGEGTLGKIVPRLVADQACTSFQDPDLEAWRTHNPAAASLPLLAAMAVGQKSAPAIPYTLEQNLQIHYEGP